MPAARRPTLLVMMGVSGCGKTTVGRRIASALDWAFLEGDSLHSRSNIARMHAGEPLNDADRWPWLDAIARWMDTRHAAGQSAVITCSALKRSYRELLARGHPGACFAWLKVERAELERRLRRRREHFMPATLLDSQLDILEPPAPDERAFTIDADGTVEATVRAALAALEGR